MAKKVEETTQDLPKLIDGKEILESYLKDKNNKDKHFNYEKDHFYGVSSGSLNFDLNAGLFAPGIHRLVGIPESGKTSFTFEVARDFLKTKNRKVLYVKAEGRLSKEMQARTGLKFVFDPKDWEDGSIFVLEANIYEFVIDLIKKLVRQNEKETEYFIIFDSMDGLILAADAEKAAAENDKVAGAPKLTKEFFKKMGLEMTKKGHLVFMLSQHTSNIKINLYEKDDGKSTVSGGGSGGWALVHFASSCLEFKPKYGKDIFFSASDKNKILGHNVKIQITKSVNEKTGTTIEYPVKYGAIGKSSIWLEKEIMNILVSFNNLKQKGAWFNLDDSIVKELNDNGYEIKSQFHGEEGFSGWLEENPEATNFLYKLFRERLTTIPKSD